MKYFFLTLVTFFFLFSCDRQEPLSEKQKAAFAIFDQVSKELREIYQLKRISFSEASIDGKYTELGLSFVKLGSLSKSEGRRLLVECVGIFLRSVNDSASIRPFLSQHPFQIENISLSIMVYGDHGEVLYKPQTSFFSLNRGKIYFKYHIPEDEYKLEHEVETYEEALEIIKKENTQ